MSGLELKSMDERVRAAAEKDAEWKQRRDDDFALYYESRKALADAELEAERSLDNLIATVSGGAIAGLFTAFTNNPWLPLLLCPFALAMLFSVLDRWLTYEAHKAYRLALDEEFQNYDQKTIWQKAEERYKGIKSIQHLSWTKPAALIALVVAVIGVVIFLQCK